MRDIITYSLLLTILFAIACTHCPTVEPKAKPVPEVVTKDPVEKSIADLYIDALDAMNTICKDADAPLIVSNGTSIAAAVSVGRMLFVKYNETIIGAIKKRYGDYAVFGIFAHELGHICDFKAGITPLEGRADVYAGCAMAMMKLDTEPFKALLKDVNREDPIHGTTEERLDNVDRGFKACKK